MRRFTSLELGTNAHTWYKASLDFHAASLALAKAYVDNQQSWMSLKDGTPLDSIDPFMCEMGAMHRSPMVNMGLALELLAKAKIVRDMLPTPGEKLPWIKPVQGKMVGHNLVWLFERAQFEINEGRNFLEYLGNLLVWGKYPITKEENDLIFEREGKQYYRSQPFAHPQVIVPVHHVLDLYLTIYKTSEKTLLETLPRKKHANGSTSYVWPY